MLTSNQGFERWEEVLHNEIMAAALLDRLLHRGHIVHIRGDSYPLRRHMELSKTIHPTASRAISAEPCAERENGTMTTAPVPPAAPKCAFSGQKCAIFDVR